jgi:hypothetical protein
VANEGGHRFKQVVVEAGRARVLAHLQHTVLANMCVKGWLDLDCLFCDFC